MDYPLQPEPGFTDSDALLERFLTYVEETGITLYPAQEEAILELYSDRHVILNTPTGSGKSLVAVAMHFRAACLRRRSIYTSPIKALVNEKFLALCRVFGPEAVGMMTGDATVNRTAPILCCTAEILANLALRNGGDAGVDDVIMDEFHYYSDRERGVAWQVPLLTLPHCRFLLMSATLGDTRFFADELRKHTGVECISVVSHDRPVPLEFTYVEDSLLDVLEQLENKNRLPGYIVHFTQRSASETAQGLLSRKLVSKDDKQAIQEAIRDTTFSSPFGKTMRKLVLAGIGLHHAGLLPKYRLLVEKLSQQGRLKVICGTDTLGVGVNIPIRTVVLTQLSKYDGESSALLTARDFHQVCGRAGRKGFDDQGYVVALAPAHVIENRKKEAKAGDDPKKKRKIVKSKPPSRGYVPWDERSFEKLKTAPPEPLQSSFAISHGMLLNVLSRSGDGCRAMQKLIRDCHEPDSKKPQLRRRAWQLFRALVDREIITIDPDRSTAQKLRVNVDLQEDFSLNQALSLYCVDTLQLLDREDPDYPLHVISLVEAILEHPKAILNRQVDKLKDDLMAEMKAAGVEYEERMEKLEAVEHPKPDADFIYETFNAFAASHPWVGRENIRPKSIAREMFERYSSFADYIKLYGLSRSEGLLLRHISQTYRVLENTIPPEFLSESLREAVVYFEHLLRHVDASLIDEWERLRNPEYQPETGLAELPSRSAPVDYTRPRDVFLRRVRDAVFSFLNLLAGKQYAELLEQYHFDPILGEPDTTQPRAALLEALLEPYYRDHPWIRLDPSARSRDHTRVEESEDGKSWTVRQTLIDPEDLNDWEAVFHLDLEAIRKEEKVLLSPLAIGPVDEMYPGN